MGVQAMVKADIASMRKTNTANIQTLEKWAKRALKVAKDAGGSDDISHQRDLEIAVGTVAEQFIDAAGGGADSLCWRLDPKLQKRREDILIKAEKMLDSFQEPSPERSEDMRAAILEDTEQLNENLKGMEEVGDTVLLKLDEHITTVKHKHIDRSNQWQTLSSVQEDHAWMIIKLHLLSENGTPEEPIITVVVSDMNEGSEVGRYYVTFDETFSDLVDEVLSSDNSAPLPDFWCRKVDPTRNRATDSGVWWEWQIPKKKVLDAINESKEAPSGPVEYGDKGGKGKGRFELRSVVQDREYIVALVGTNGKESGTPICIPREDRKPASEFLQNSIFSNQKVSRLLDMEKGTDISSIIFDNRNFDHKTNPLFVELDELTPRTTAMGVQAMVKGSIANMRKTNVTNIQALDKWAKRALKIAKDMGGSNDASRQRDLETAVGTVAKLFIDAAGMSADSICTKMDPDIQKKREEILLEAEQMLDSFQEPPPERSDDMRAAIQEDTEQLKKELNGIEEVGDTVLLKLDEHITIAESGGYNVDKLHQWQTLSSAQKDHARMARKLHLLYENGTPEEPIITVVVSDMNQDSEVGRYCVTLEETFSDLVDEVLSSDNSAPLPDFWCRKVDPTRNRATDSGVWWEWQIPKKKVLDAINESKEAPSGQVKYGEKGGKGKGRFELRSVVQDREYIVALVGTNGKESGTPICIPREDRKPASEFLQNSIFPNQRVARLLDMEKGTDISSIIFDNRNFDHKTNPLFVELDGLYD